MRGIDNKEEGDMDETKARAREIAFKNHKAFMDDTLQ